MKQWKQPCNPRTALQTNKKKGKKKKNEKRRRCNTKSVEPWSRIQQRTVVASSLSRRAGLTRLAVFPCRINSAVVSLLSRRNFHILACFSTFVSSFHLLPLTAVISFLSRAITGRSALFFRKQRRRGGKSSETFVRFPNRKNSETISVAALASLNMATETVSRSRSIFHSPTLSLVHTLAHSLSLSLSLFPFRNADSSPSNAQTELACTRLPREVRSFPRRPDQSESLCNVDLRRWTYRVSRSLPETPVYRNQNPEYSPSPRARDHETSPDENERPVGPLIGGISRRFGWRQPRIFRTLRFVSGESHPPRGAADLRYWFSGGKQNRGVPMICYRPGGSPSEIREVQLVT